MNQTPEESVLTSELLVKPKTSCKGSSRRLAMVQFSYFKLICHHKKAYPEGPGKPAWTQVLMCPLQ